MGRAPAPCSSGAKGVRSAQKMQVGPHIPVGIQLQKAEVGPASGPTWLLSHFGQVVDPGLAQAVGAALPDRRARGLAGDVHDGAGRTPQHSRGVALAIARKVVLGWPRDASWPTYIFQWEYSHKRLQLAQLMNLASFSRVLRVPFRSTKRCTRCEIRYVAVHE